MSRLRPEQGVASTWRSATTDAFLPRAVRAPFVAYDMMPDSLPKALQLAMTSLVDAEAEFDRNPTPDQRLTRIDTLRATRAVLGEWRDGRMTMEQAVLQLDALARSMRDV